MARLEGFSDIIQYCHTWVVHPGPLQKGEARGVLPSAPQSRSAPTQPRGTLVALVAPRTKDLRWLLSPPYAAASLVLRQGGGVSSQRPSVPRQMSDALPFWGHAQPGPESGGHSRAEFPFREPHFLTMPRFVVCPRKGHLSLTCPRRGEALPSALHCHIFLPFHTVHGVPKARILKWFTMVKWNTKGHSPFPSEPRFVRTLHHDQSVLGSPTRHGS